MGKVIFNEKGYEYLDYGNRVIFSDDRTHIKLFDYISSDISSISRLLEKHCSDRMNLRTFDLNASSYSSEKEIDKIKTILSAAHPYYQHEIEKVIIQAIGTYFNNLLKYSVFTPNNHIDSSVVKYDWYKERFVTLVPSSMRSMLSLDRIPGHDDFWDKYCFDMGDRNLIYEEDAETIAINVPEHAPTPFSFELYTQREIANMLYFILDLDAENIHGLSLQQRAFLYSNIFPTSTSVSQELSLKEPIRFYLNVDQSKEYDETNKRYGIFSPIYSLRNVNIVQQGIPTAFQNQLASAIEFCRGIESSDIYETYNIDRLEQLLFLEVLRMIQSGERIRKCKNCEKYFTVNNCRAVYCKRKGKSGKTCSEVGPNRAYKKKISEDDARALYDRAYNTHYARTKNKNMTQNKFYEWDKTAKSKLEQVRSGELDLETFKAWLKK